MTKLVGGNLRGCGVILTVDKTRWVIFVRWGAMHLHENCWNLIPVGKISAECAGNASDGVERTGTEADRSTSAPANKE